MNAHTFVGLSPFAKNSVIQKIDRLNNKTVSTYSDDDNIKKTPTEIINIICEYFSVDYDHILSTSSKRELVMPRQIAMQIIRNAIPDMSLKKIGVIFNRHHSSVIYAINTADDLIDADVKFRYDYNEILKLI